LALIGGTGMLVRYSVAGAVCERLRC